MKNWPFRWKFDNDGIRTELVAYNMRVSAYLLQEPVETRDCICDVSRDVYSCDTGTNHHVAHLHVWLRPLPSPAAGLYRLRWWSAGAIHYTCLYGVGVTVGPSHFPPPSTGAGASSVDVGY